MAPAGFLIALAAQLAVPASPPAPLEVKYLHSLSSNTGILPLAGVTLSYDPAGKDLFVAGNGLVRVFNESGMEVYAFGEDPELGGILSAVPLEGGDILALTYLDGKLSLLRANFRGERIGTVEPRGIPQDFADVIPTTIRYAAGKIWLADTARMKVIVLDDSGGFVTSYDVARILDLEKQRADTGIRGFTVDREENLLVTIQPLFRAYVISPDRKVRSFGQKGSAPGKFNVVSGIARDDAGNFYVADILRSVVIVFDPEFRFLREFGYRGRGEGSLAAPDEIAVGDGKLYVANHARRGVSVFKVSSSDGKGDSSK